MYVYIYIKSSIRGDVFEILKNFRRSLVNFAIKEAVNYGRHGIRVFPHTTTYREILFLSFSSVSINYVKTATIVASHELSCV